MGHPSPRYSAEFKQQAVRLHRERGGTCAETAREPGVDPGSLSDWVKKADTAQASPEATPSRWPRRTGACAGRSSGPGARTRCF
ncbi:transposase [Collinsella tanakaei]|nr:transposase [Collinsella tanakaei]